MIDWTQILGKTRDEVKAILGEPDDIAICNRSERKRNMPSIYLYLVGHEEIEVWFETWRTGRAVQVFNNSTHETICKWLSTTEK
jgi:hypothetical protein